jgi:hypothetical protein
MAKASGVHKRQEFRGQLQRISKPYNGLAKFLIFCIAEKPHSKGGMRFLGNHWATIRLKNGKNRRKNGVKTTGSVNQKKAGKPARLLALWIGGG